MNKLHSYYSDACDEQAQMIKSGYKFKVILNKKDVDIVDFYNWFDVHEAQASMFSMYVYYFVDENEAMMCKMLWG